LGIILNSLMPAYAQQSNNSFIPKISSVDNNLNPTFISGELTEKSADSVEKIIEKYYSGKSKAYSDSNGQKDKQFKILKQSKASRGRTIVQTIQTYNGIPVFGSEQNFTINADGIIECIIGKTVENIEDKLASSESSIQASKQDVLSAVEKHLGFKPDYVESPKLDLVLYPVKDKYVYSYKVNIGYDKPNYSRYTYYVDANNLSVLAIFSQVSNALQATTGTGIGQFDKTNPPIELKLSLNTEDNRYYLVNAIDKVTTSRYNEIYEIETYSEPDSFFDSGALADYQKDAVDAHYNISKILEFFKNTFGRNGNDGKGSPYNITIDNYATQSLNSYGSINHVTFDVGHGSYATRSSASCMDVAGHEFTHGILASEGLSTSYNGTETDSMQEGLADVFGVVCEYFITNEGIGTGTSFEWYFGEDAGFLERDCASPYINDYQDYINRPTAPEPHKGGGVITKAAYLIAEGGIHNGTTVSAISSDRDTAYTKLAKIFYDVIDNNLIPNMTFIQFAEAAVFSANTLYGSTEAQTVKDAFTAVLVLPNSAGPQNFAMTNRDGFNAEFSWSGTTGASYAIYRKVTGSALFSKITEITSNTTYTAKTLPGSYDFCVAQVDSNGRRTSEFSNVVTVNSNYLTAPESFTGTSGSNFNVQFSWNGTSGTYYAIYKKDTGASTALVKATDTITGSACTIKTLPGSFDFCIAQVDSDGNRLSDFSSAVTIQNDYLAAPANLRISSRSSSGIGLSWDGVSTLGDYRYEIYNKFSGSADSLVTRFRTNETSCSIQFECSSNYDFYVAIVDSEGNRFSELSNAVTAVPWQNAPVNFRISSRSSSGIAFSWDADSTPGDDCYAVYQKVSGSADTPIKRFQTTDTSCSFQSTPSVNYDYYVVKVDSLGIVISNPSNVVTAAPWQAPVYSLDISSRSSSGVTLSWSGGCNPGDIYAIYKKVSGSADNPDKCFQTTDMSCSLQFTGDVSYDFYVAKVDSSGNRISELSIAATVAPWQCPVYTLSVASRNNTEVTLSWDGGCNTGDIYAIYKQVSGSSDNPSKCFQTTDKTYSFQFTDNVSCDFYVAKVDSLGNKISEFSMAVTLAP
ncbi:MAG TPA: M4 family metallopeptidase, partial [Clostridia bacterium]|nr:M4 family metallopeptidase [Clostridia bacterium]